MHDITAFFDSEIFENNFKNPNENSFWSLPRKELLHLPGFYWVIIRGSTIWIQSVEIKDYSNILCIPYVYILSTCCCYISAVSMKRKWTSNIMVWCHPKRKLLIHMLRTGSCLKVMIEYYSIQVWIYLYHQRWSCLFFGGITWSLNDNFSSEHKWWGAVEFASFRLLYI